MAKFQIKSFIIGKEKIPTWFNDEVSKCRAKINYDEDGGLTNVIIYSPTKQLFANEGDTIMLLKSGLTVIKKEQAKKYISKKHQDDEGGTL